MNETEGLSEKDDRPEPISDEDMIFDRGAATVDRIALNRTNPGQVHGLRASSEGEEGWGFKIRHWLHWD